MWFSVWKHTYILTKLCAMYIHIKTAISPVKSLLAVKQVPKGVCESNCFCSHLRVLGNNSGFEGGAPCMLGSHFLSLRSHVTLRIMAAYIQPFLFGDGLIMVSSLLSEI